MYQKGELRIHTSLYNGIEKLIKEVINQKAGAENWANNLILDEGYDMIYVSEHGEANCNYNINMKATVSVAIIF